MEQLTKEGLFVGGTPPYGYKLCKFGRINKRGYEVHDVLIDDKEAAVVKKVFSLYCTGEMGTYQIAQYLSNNGIESRTGTPWRSSSVANILKNISYIGIRRFGGAKSEILPHLQIIDHDTFAFARKQAEKNKVIKPSKSRKEYTSTVLFTDLVYCMHCGKKMAVERKKKHYINKFGRKTTSQHLKYSCINRGDAPRCDGQRVYSTKIIDEQMSAVISKFLQTDIIGSINDLISIPSSITDKINGMVILLENEKNNLDILKSEVVEVIRGTSAFGSILLNELIKKTELQIAALKDEIINHHNNLRMQKFKADKFNEIYKQIITDRGATLMSFDFDAQKNAINRLIERLYLGRGYKYRIEWKFGGYTQGEPDTVLE